MKVKRLTWSLVGLLAFILTLQGNGQPTPVLINSYFNAGSASSEWTELIVVQDNISLNNWSIRDNASNGNWQTAINFKDIPFWSNLRRGTIIIINHRAVGNLPTNADKADGFIRVNANDPSFFSFSGSSFPSTALDLSANGDMIQLRDAQLNHRHALGHRNHASDTAIAYFNALPAPKYSHSAILSTNEALMFCPGANENDYGYFSPWIGNSFTTKSTTKTAGLPSPCGPNDSNRQYWRQLRQPEWNNPSATASYYNENNQIQLQWNAMTDPNPADYVSGYLVLRSSTNSFQSPKDGESYITGQTLGSATVVAQIQGSVVNTFIDNSPLGCGQTYHYRVYAYRFSTDLLLGNNAELARGRAYNETNFAQTSVTRQSTSAIVSISASATTVAAGTNITLNAQAVNGGSSPTFTWYANNQPIGSGSSIQYTVFQSVQIHAMMNSNHGCIVQNPVQSNTISINIALNPCNPGQISGSSVICVNSSEQYTIVGGTPGGTWSSSNTSIATVSGIGLTATVITHATGSFTLSYILPEGCTGQNSAQKSITVNPDATVGQDQVLCGIVSTQLVGNAPLSGDAFWILHEGPSFLVNYHPNIYSPTVQITVPIAGFYTFRWSISGGSCSTSDFIVVEFKERKQVAVSIEAFQPVCQGMPITLKALAVNGGSSPTFQWFRNNIPFGSNSQTLQFVPQPGDQVRVELTSSLDCVVSPTASSAEVSVLPNSLPTDPSLVSASMTEICAGQSNPLILTASGGSGSNLYWYKNDCSGNPIGTGTQLQIDPPTQTTTYFARWETENCGVSSCKSVSVQVIENAVPSVNISSNISTNNICEGQLVVFTAQANNGGSGATYQWFVNGTMQTETSSVFSTTQLNGPSPEVYCRMFSSLACVSQSSVISNTIQINVQAVIAPQISITASQLSVCSSQLVHFHVSSSAGGGMQASFQWKINGVPVQDSVSTTFSWTFNENAVVTCSMQSSETCVSVGLVDSNPLLVQVTPSVLPTISINPVNSNYCEGSTIAFTAFSTHGGTSPAYQWYLNDIPQAGQNAINWNLPSAAPGEYRVMVRMQSSHPCAIETAVFSNEINFTIQSIVTPQVEINASTSEVCSGDIIELQANATNFGVLPVYQWFVNGNQIPDASSPFLSLPLASNASIYVKLLVAENCVTVNPAISNAIQINVLPWLQPEVMIETPSNQACSGTLVTMTASTVHPGTQPTYSWFVNGELQQISGQASFSFIPVHQNIVRAELQASGNCLLQNNVSSNEIEFTVLPNPENPSQAIADREVICEGDTGHISLSVLGGNGVNLHWYKDDCYGELIGQGNPLLIAAPQISTSFFARWETPLCGISDCAQIGVTVNQQITPLISIVAAQNGVCSGNEVQFSSNSSGQGQNPVFQWSVNGINSGVNSSMFTYIPENEDVVQCSLLSSESCANPVNAISEPITMVVHPIVSPSLVIEPAASAVCEGTFVVFEANPVQGGATPTYQWFVNNIERPETGSTLTLNSASGNYEVSAVLHSSENCAQPEMANSNTAQLTVSQMVQPSISISVDQLSVCEGETVQLHCAFENGGTAPMLQWFVNDVPIAGANSTSFTFIPTDGESVHCELTSNHECATQVLVSSAIVEFLVSNIITPTVSISSLQSTICQGNNIEITSSVTGVGSSPSYQWFVNDEPSGNSAQLNFIPDDGDRVFCVVTSDLACADPSVVQSDIIIISVLPLVNSSINILTASQQLCEGSLINVEAVVEHAGETPIFSWRLNGIETGNNQPFMSFVPQQGDQLQCKLESSESCVVNPTVLSNILEFEVSAVFQPEISINTPGQQVCNGESVTIQTNVAAGGFTPGFTWFLNGQPTAIHTSVFQFIPADNDRIQCQISVDAQCAIPSVSMSNEIIFSVSENVEPGIQLIEDQNQLCSGENVLIHAHIWNGGQSPVFQWYVNNQLISHSGSEFSIVPANHDEVYCILTSAEICAQPSQVISNSIIFSVADPVAANNILVTNAYCNENNGTLQIQVQGGTPPYQYSITNGNDWTTNAHFSGLSAGNYMIHVADSRNCQLETPASISIEQLGVPQIHQLVLSPASGGLNNGSVSVYAVGQQPLLYSSDAINWQSSSVFSDLPAGNHTIYVKDQNDCISSQAYSIETGAILLSAGTSQNCKGGSASVEIQTNGFSTVEYFKILIHYDPNLLDFVSTESIWPGLSNNELAITSSAGEILITYHGMQGIQYPGGGGLLQLNFNLLQSGLAEIIISDESTIASPEGNAYLLQFANGGIAINQGPLVTITGNPEICQGQRLQLSIAQNTASQGRWIQPDGSIINGHTISIESISYGLRGVYTAMITDNDGCINTEEVFVDVKLCDFAPSIPNAFRPHSNPPNNAFQPLFGPVEPVLYNMKIFNRWGQLVFETNDYLEGWTGTSGNSASIADTYVYLIVYKLPAELSSSPEPKMIKGNVTLVK